MAYKDQEKRKRYLKKYNKKNKDKLKEKHKEYYQKNKDQLKEEAKKWREKNKEYRKKWKKEYYQKNKEKIREKLKEYYQKNKEKFKERGQIWSQNNRKKQNVYRQKNREKIREKGKKWRGEIKLRVYNHYSNYDIKCNCCGERHIDFLSIDHIDNGGAEHRKKMKNTINITYWLFKNNYPSGYQILCMNCNFAKGKDPEHLCPHQKQIAQKILFNSQE